MSSPGYSAGHSPITRDPTPNGARYTMNGGAHPQSIHSNSSTQADVEIVRVQPQDIAPVDPTSAKTLHRELNANQVHTFT
jgi:hypothetical protein